MKSKIMVRPLLKVTSLFAHNRGDRLFYVLVGKNETGIVVADDIYADESFERYDRLTVTDANGKPLGKDFIDMEILDVISNENFLIDGYNLENFDGFYKTI